MSALWRRTSGGTSHSGPHFGQVIELSSGFARRINEPHTPHVFSCRTKQSYNVTRGDAILPEARTLQSAREHNLPVEAPGGHADGLMAPERRVSPSWYSRRLESRTELL